MFGKFTLGLLSAGLVIAPAAHASETRAYVVRMMAPAMNSVEGDCPEGLNPGTAELLRTFILQQGGSEAELDEIASNRDAFGRYAPNRGRIDGEPVNTYIYPLSVPDTQVHINEGTEGIGFDLDGRDDPEDFTDPFTGETGVDHQESRVMGCYTRLRTSSEHPPTGGALLWNGVREGMPAWVIEFSGLDDLENDDDVTVQFFRANEPITKDALGETQPYMSYTLNPHPAMQDNIFHGSIEDGMFVSDEPIRFWQIAESYVQPEFDLVDARLRFKFEGENIRGVLGGYQPIDMTYVRYSYWGEGGERAQGMDSPAIYHALRRLADGPVNPETGERDRISTAQQIWAIPAFIVRGAEAGRDAETAAALEFVQSQDFSQPDGVDMPRGVHLASVRFERFTGNAFSDAQGRPYYYRAAGSADACDAACMEKWIPVQFSPDAELSGEWSVEANGDVRQLAYNGRPLFRFSDETPSRNKIVGEDRGGDRVPTAAGYERGVWEVAQATPDWIDLPVGFAIAESLIAPGQILVTDNDEKPLYAFSGSEEEELALSREWVPFTAGALDIPTEGLSISERADGLRVWEYDGRRLYTFAGDILSGDLNGKFQTGAMSPAVVQRYFVPDEVYILPNQLRGGRLVEAATGRTLYARDRIFFSSFSYNSRGAGRGSPETGRALGVKVCDAECEQEWAPLLASPQAAASGNWTLVQRPDGQQQWAYRGYPLYSNRNEEPGETLSSEEWEFTFDNGHREVEDEDFGLALFWRVAVP